MKRLLILAIALMLALAPLSSARAGEPDARAIENLLAGVEELIGGIEGVNFQELEVRKQGRLYSVAIPIPEATRERLLARSASAGDFKPLACGLQLSNPGSFSSLITAVSALDDTDYNFWFATMNLRSSDQVKKTTFQRKGLGEKFKVVDTLLYEAASLVLFTLEANSGVGSSTIQVKITGGGKAKTGYFAQ